tara:strand:+ start:13112 stop:14014 length:903 start_codon:yes stop_codon:yes gene_type:complete
MRYLFSRFFLRLKRDGLVNVILFIFKFFFQSEKKINLDTLEISNNKKLDDYFLIFGTDKGFLDGKKTFYKISKTSSEKKFLNYKDWVLRQNIYNFDYELGQNFTPVYEKFFEHIKLEKLDILEIGVAGGHSHASWYMYFPNSNIYGIDIKPQKELLYSGNRLKYYQFDILKKNQVDIFLKKGLKFDIIIDDSLHDFDAFIANLFNFFPSLKRNGLFFLEDFLQKDIRLERLRSYNQKYGKKLTKYDLTIEEILTNLSKKNIFKSDYISEDNQINLHNNIKDLEINKLDYPDAAIAVIRKR